MSLKNIGDLTPDELEEYLIARGEKSFRAKQIFKWVHTGAESYDLMTDISLKLREELKKEFMIFIPSICKKYVSEDGTVKYLLKLSDNHLIETVVMDYKHGKSICISSQVGCRMGCSFCASTLSGLVRSLTPFEMEGQIIRAEKDLGTRISSVVIMGIGEPFDNYDNLLKFLKNVNSSDGLSLGLRHITVSTCGLADKIDALAKENIPVNLAISLHAPSDEKRKQIMPVAKAYPLDILMKSCDNYFEKTHRRITFEYALISGKNSSKEDAKALSALLRGKNCHVNIIPVNPVRERDNSEVSPEDTENFKKLLERGGINATVRRRLGSDINASCGQLRNKEMNKS